MKKLGSIALLAALSALPALGQGTLVEGKFLITTFDAPPGTPTGNEVLNVSAINDFGAITGYVFAGVPFPSVPIVSYLGSFNGTTLAKLAAPGSDGLITQAFGINDYGTVAGTYFNVTADHVSGFIYNNGTYQTYDFPGLPAGYGTSIYGINNFGVICGDASGIENASDFVPFVDNHGKLDTNFNIPGATVIMALGINDYGAVVGTYVDPTNLVRSFLRGATGAMTRIDVPGAAFGTSVFGINDLGWVSGNFYDAENHRHGFLRSPEGTFYQIDVPGAATNLAAGGTGGGGLNNFGVVVGHYDPDDGGPERGYVALLQQQ